MKLLIDVTKNLFLNSPSLFNVRYNFFTKHKCSFHICVKKLKEQESYFYFCK